MPAKFPAAKTSSPFTSMRADHVAVRVPDIDEAIEWFTRKLDFRVVHRWPFGELQLAYLATPVDSTFKLELIAGPGAVERKPYKDLGDSLGLAGWHHFCFMVDSVDTTVDELRRRGVKIVAEPFELAIISRKLAFFSDPWGNLFELAEILG